ncbi:MAG: TIGR04282 family arsenosugar biosynthesis glycosyltransferase [Chromatiales bacterium]|nr:TIGR04282 family arsenosugar biosynthesis glycosyltransferase [Chromatiales bacterium]
MRFPDAKILVMARAPVAGKAKTRLIPALGEAGAAQLHAFLVERLLNELSHAEIAQVALCCTPNIDHPFFHHCRDGYGVTLQVQQGEGLGERLHHALSISLEHHRYAVVIGCDIPLLDSAVISEALQALQAGNDAAITPTEDGGYALLAVRASHPQLFHDIDWGSEKVFAQTIQRFDELQWRWHELACLWDVDTAEDYRRLLSHTDILDRFVTPVSDLL